MGIHKTASSKKDRSVAVLSEDERSLSYEYHFFLGEYSGDIFRSCGNFYLPDAFLEIFSLLSVRSAIFSLLICGISKRDFSMTIAILIVSPLSMPRKGFPAFSDLCPMAFALFTAFFVFF